MISNYRRVLVLSAATICGLLQASQASVAVHCDSVICTQSPYFHGCNYSAFWDDLQLSTGSRDALRRSGVQIIRFPGGWPGNAYDWKNPISTSGTYESKTSYTQFWAYAQNIGAKCLFQTNWDGLGPNSDKTTPVPVTGAYVAEWVDSCKRFGVDVPLWEIGNEPDNATVTSQLDWSAMNPYFHVFNTQTPAMKAANSAITVMGPSSTNTWYWQGPGPNYPAYILKMFMDSCSTTADAISIHWYLTGGAGLSTADRWNLTRSAAQQWPKTISYIDARAKQKPIYIT